MKSQVTLCALFSFLLGCSPKAQEITKATASVQGAVHKEAVIRREFAGVISDIATFNPSPGKQSMMILAQKEGFALNEAGEVVQHFSFPNCTYARVAQNESGKMFIYCEGGAFGPVYAADINGNILWKFASSEMMVWKAVRGPNQNFYVATSNGARILNSEGAIIAQSAYDLVQLAYFPEAPLITISKRGLSDRNLELRDEHLNVVKSFPMKEFVSDIIAFDWPKKDAICYTTDSELIAIDESGKPLKRVDLKGEVTRGSAQVVAGEDGSKYLGLLVLYDPRMAKSRLFILSSNFDIIYQETLPISRAISTVKWQGKERLMVGVGSSGINAYEIRGAR